MISKHANFLNTGAWCSVLAAVCLAASAVNVSAGGMRLSRWFNHPGNILIADQFNNRVIEATPAGDIIWSFGLGPNDFSPRSVIGVNAAQRVGPYTLMAG